VDSAAVDGRRAGRHVLAFLEELIETLRTGKVVTPAQSSQIE